jgi:hypothetical protein
MNGKTFSADDPPHFRPGSETNPSDERALVLEDVRIAEEQIARGEGVAHDEAKRRVLTRLRR